MSRIEEFDRNTVLLNAMNAFWEKGYNGTSMQDLVDATKLNRSSIYNSFGSKLELYQQTLKHYSKNGDSQFQKALLKANGPVDAIQLIFESFLPEILGDEENKGCFVLNCKSEMGNQEQNINKWLLSQQESTLTLFEGLVADGQSNGTINTLQDSKTYAYHLFSGFQGFRMTGILVKDKKILKQIINNTISIII